MKIFLTEIDDPFNDKKYVGPYIKALSIEEAQKIAYENASTISDKRLPFEPNSKK